MIPKNLFDDQASFQLLYDLSYDPLLIFRKFQFIDCNQAALRFFKFSSKTELKRRIAEFFATVNQSRGEKFPVNVSAMFQKAYSKGYHRFEWDYLDRNGESIGIDVSLAQVPNRDGKYLFALLRDISKQKAYEKSLTQSEKLYSLLFEQAADGMLVGIGKGEIVEANQSICLLTGYTKEELIGRNIKLLFSEDELEKNPLRYDLVKVGNTIVRERNIVCKDGRVIPVEMNTKILEDGRMQALFRDLSVRKAAEKALRDSEEKYRNVFQYAPLGIFHYNQQGIITDCNKNFIEIIGSSKEQLIGLNMLTELNNEEIKTKIKTSIQSGEEVYENWYTSITGKKTTFVKGVFKCIYSEENQFISGLGLIEDITQRKKAELALMESEQKYRMLFENAGDAIMLMNEEKFIDCNKKALDLLGISKHELIGKPPYQFSPKLQPDGSRSRQKTREKIREALQGKPKVFEWVHQKADGTNFFTEVSLNVFGLNSPGTVQAIIRDISERKEFEQRIYKAIIETEERERQRLASDIHDEIGPVLSSLKVYIESINHEGEKEKQEYIKNKLQELIKETIDNVREVSNAISPYLLNKYGLKTAIDSFFKKTANILRLNFKSNLQTKRFPLKTEIVYYRVIKELVNNTIKHARAKNIDVHLHYKKSELILIYQDDGVSLDKQCLASDNTDGMGLFNIIHRINSIQGDYKIYDQASGFKFRLVTKVPVLRDTY
ncbi:MAG: PAS domain S-box protein [Bacteroidales bacterium]|jgi:PAS domain S-box-containing protein|nr:PAS domain S-box protein [Bacteroidales bacterium]